VRTPHTLVEASAGAFFQNTPRYPVSECYTKWWRAAAAIPNPNTNSRNWHVGWNSPDRTPPELDVGGMPT
jgi:hypothetical protein